MRTINQALAPYRVTGQRVTPLRHFTPECSAGDGNQARWVVLYPEGVEPLFLCFTHYEEQWLPMASEMGTMGREARLVDY